MVLMESLEGEAEGSLSLSAEASLAVLSLEAAKKDGHQFQSEEGGLMVAMVAAIAVSWFLSYVMSPYTQ